MMKFYYLGMKNILLLICIALTSVIQAQRYNQDSLRTLFYKSPDTVRVNLLYEIGYAYSGDQLDSALFYYDKALLLSENIHYAWGQVKYYGYATAVLHSKGEFKEALELNKMAVSKCLTLPCYELLADQYINVGNDFQYLTEYDSAVYYYLEARKVYEKENDSASLAFVYGNIAEIYSSQKRKKEALAYARISMKYVSRKTDSYIYRNLLYNMARDEYNMNLYDDAFNHFKEVEKLAREAKDDYLLLLLMDSYFTYYTHFGEFEKLPQSANEFYALAEPMNSELLMANAYYLKGISAFYQKQFGDAELNIFKAISLTEDEAILMPAYITAADIALAKQHDVRLYWKYNHIADSLRDKMTDANILKNSQELEKKYETEKKEQQLVLRDEEITQKKLWISVLAISILALLIVLIAAMFIYRSKQQLQQQQILQLENEKLLSATKAVLKGQDEERTRLAKDLHDGLGSMLSGIKFSFTDIKQNMVMTSEQYGSFGRSLDMLDTSIRELRRVAHNMMPESLLKFGLDAALNDLCIQAEQTGRMKVIYQSMGLNEGEIDNEIILNVYRVIQELVNNAIKYSSATQLLVQLSFDQKNLSITVEDNGKGFNTEMSYSGLGWKNIRNRIASIHGILDAKSEMDKGVSIFIQIPVKA